MLKDQVIFKNTSFFKLAKAHGGLKEASHSTFIIQVLIGGLLGYMLARGIGGGMIPRRREEKRKREKERRGKS